MGIEKRGFIASVVFGGVAFALAAVELAPARALAQTPDPLVASVKAQFTTVTNYVIRSADKIPEKLYTFRPTPEVRTIADLFGHIADEDFAMCATAAGATPPRTGIEATVKKKADLAKALTEAAAYCDSVMSAMTPARGVEIVPFYFGPTPRLSVLYFVASHTNEHYGNLVTYMRLKSIVPPSSETQIANR